MKKKTLGRRLKLLTPETDLVTPVFARMLQGHPNSKPRGLQRLKSWFLTRVRERNYPTVPFGGESEQKRRRRQILGLAGALLTDANGVKGIFREAYAQAYATEFPHLLNREVA